MTTTLQNYPNLNQRVVPVNGENDCVPTSLADGLEYLTGKHYNVYDIVTAAYGPNYKGFTSARAFIPFCTAQGVALSPIDGDNATLVKALHTEIQALHPCLLTEPDVYAPLHPEWSHVLSVYREDSGSLTARDPYSTKDVTHSDAEWEKLLEFREIWTMKRIATAGVPAGWKDDGHNLYGPQGEGPVVLGFREFVLANNWNPSNVPVGPQYYTQQLEVTHPDLGDGDQIIFLLGTILGYPHNPKDAGFKHKVMVEYAGKELVALRQQVMKYYTLAKDMHDRAAELEADLQAVQKIALPQ